jgi:hypothetical protein
MADTSNSNTAVYSSANGHTQGTANFSRPGAMASGSASSSQANVARSAATSNGEPVDPTTERGESMRNRGRYSYASSVSPANVSSPRRVRRRKDPTPFK